MDGAVYIEPPQQIAEYGIFSDSVKSAAASLQEAAQKIGAWLADTFENVTSVHVSTYVSDNLSLAKYEGGVFSGATLRAVTKLGGIVELAAPQSLPNDGKVIADER